MSNPRSNNLPANEPPDPAVMTEITLVLESISKDNPETAEKLLALVYEQLRELAHSRMRQEPNRGGGMTLNATALVHEAYLRVIGDQNRQPQLWQNRGHFFGAAALAMRRILVELPVIEGGSSTAPAGNGLTLMASSFPSNNRIRPILSRWMRLSRTSNGLMPAKRRWFRSGISPD